MTRKEALKFLDLPEYVTDKQFKKRLDEKLEHYGKLSEKAPSAFLRRLNSQHLSTAKLIQKDIFAFQSQQIIIPPIQEELELSSDIGIDDDALLTTPVILPSKLKPPVKKNVEPEPVAFLVRHTENQSVKLFSLYAGNNFIGRKMHPTIKPFIALENDEYVSRIHALIYIEEADPAGSYIEDSVLSNAGKPSKNGTFVNGNKQRLKEQLKIKENDTIQIGETKLILKMNTTNIHKIVEEVEDSDYMHTVVIRR